MSGALLLWAVTSLTVAGAANAQPLAPAEVRLTAADWRSAIPGKLCGSVRSPTGDVVLANIAARAPDRPDACDPDLIGTWVVELTRHRARRLPFVLGMDSSTVSPDGTYAVLDTGLDSPLLVVSTGRLAKLADDALRIEAALTGRVTTWRGGDGVSLLEVAGPDGDTERLIRHRLVGWEPPHTARISGGCCDVAFYNTVDVESGSRRFVCGIDDLDHAWDAAHLAVPVCPPWRTGPVGDPPN